MAAREGQAVGARDSAHDGVVAPHGAKWLRTPVAEAPKYRREARPDKLNALEVVLKQALTADARRPKHERRTARALHAQIKAAGYDDGYSAVTDFVRAWSPGEGQAVNVTASFH